MRTAQIEANALARVFGQSSLQTNWQTETLELTSATLTGTSVYPILNPGSDASSRFKFTFDAVLMGVGCSGVWITAAANESASFAIAPKLPKLRICGAGIYFHSEIFCRAAVTASQIIQRNPGFMFPPPLVKYVPAGTVVQMYGTHQTDIFWHYTASLYYVTVQDYLRSMDLATI